ncbi:MAG TPA: flagellar motor protein MotD [Noviherbaspirillum sp.]
MARKRIQDDEDNHERWLVSYADFITLLFAFFVVMYALSSVNEGKYRQLSDSLLTAFGGASVLPSEGASLPAAGSGARLARAPERKDAALIRRETERLTTMARDIQHVLAPLVEEGKVRVRQSERGITVEINASVLFAQGDARLAPASVQALRAVAEVLRMDDHAIQVEGHTDSVPINNVAFPSNWELSAVRAGSVVRLFADVGVVEPRMTTVGYGSTRPIASNQTEEGRQRNRRVEVLIMSHLPASTREVALPERGAESEKEKG